MSTLNRIFSDIASLIAPAECVSCGKVLSNRLEWICMECYADMAATSYHLYADNPIAERLKNTYPMVVNATAHYFYVEKGVTRSVIHAMKYKRAWHIGFRLGYEFGHILSQAPLYQDIDLVIGIPIHPRRLLQRRYNQSSKIAKGLSKAMGLKCDDSSIVRLRNNPSQVTQSKRDRWENVESLFRVAKPDRIAGKHILLVDDVFTTGATISSCIEAIITESPSTRVSIATIAVSYNEIWGRGM